MVGFTYRLNVVAFSSLIADNPLLPIFDLADGHMASGGFQMRADGIYQNFF